MPSTPYWVKNVTNLTSLPTSPIIIPKFEITFDELASRRRKRNLSQARAVFCYLAVDKLEYSGENMAKTLKISWRGVRDCRDRGKKILDNPEIINKYLT